MNPSTLNELRHVVRDEQAIDALRALASAFPPTDQITEAIDACIARIEELIDTAKSREADMSEFLAQKEKARRAGGAIPVHHHYYGG